MKNSKESKLSEKMTIKDAIKWESLGYELICDNGDISGIVKREEPHAVRS